MRESHEHRIDYARVRSSIEIAVVLEWVGWEPVCIRGPQRRGRCPLPECPSRSPRTFSVHLGKQVYRCFGCGRYGNQLDLWAALQGLTLYHAAIDLCHRAGQAVPYTRTGSFTSPRNHPAGPH